MRRLLAITVLAGLIWSGMAATPAGATHDMVYAPCDPEDTRSVDERVWYIDYQSGVILRYDDPWWSERPGLAGYTNWHHQCRLGMTGVWQLAPISPLPHPPDYVVETRSTIACDAAAGYTRMGAVEIGQRVDALIPDGLNIDSLTITDIGIIISGTPSPLLFEAGIIREYAIDHNGTSRHYLDLYWEYNFSHLPDETFWEAGCTTAPPPTTTTVVPTTTTQAVSTTAPGGDAPVTTTTQATDHSTPAPQAPVTTTTQAIENPTPAPAAPVTTTTQAAPNPAPEQEALEDTPSALQAIPDSLPAGYDLWTAQYGGWPFMETIILLEERYPQGTPGKYHFRLSSAVEFLRSGGMVGQLDNVWNN